MYNITVKRHWLYFSPNEISKINLLRCYGRLLPINNTFYFGSKTINEIKISWIFFPAIWITFVVRNCTRRHKNTDQLWHLVSKWLVYLTPKKKYCQLAHLEKQWTWYEVLLVCRWESYVTLFWAAFLLRIRFDRILYIFPGKLYVSAVSYTTAVTRKSPASHLPWSSSHSLSCYMMLSHYRSLTSTPIMDKNEDSSLYREHESCFTVGMNPVRVSFRTPSKLYESPCHFTKASQIVCQMGHNSIHPAISE